MASHSVTIKTTTTKTNTMRTIVFFFGLIALTSHAFAQESTSVFDDTVVEKENMEPIKLDKKELDDAIDLLYEMMGWDREGKPTRAKLIELDLEWAIQEIY